MRVSVDILKMRVDFDVLYACFCRLLGFCVSGGRVFEKKDRDCIS